jgi:hypothetical protein
MPLSSGSQTPAMLEQASDAFDRISQRSAHGKTVPV